MRKTTTWVTVLVFGLALAAAAGISACGKKAEEVAEGTTYTCPMHPEVTSDKPGECPQCGMDLVPVKESGEAEETIGVEEITAAAYTCPMHADVKSDKPGECPQCGMDLAPVEEGEHGSGEMPEHGGM
ncbi:MAG TPA: heavy metal-binding domain-containing protein [bacterium]|nr:heavy metal-binding domain-containing protein [bacterium]